MVVTVARALRELEAVYGLTGATLELSRDAEGSLAMLLPRQRSAAIVGRGATAAAVVALHDELERLADELVAEAGRG